MAYRTILTVTRPGVDNGDLRRAADLCETAKAHLSVLVLAAATAPPVGEYAALVSEGWLAERQADAEALQGRYAEVAAFLASRQASSDARSAYPEMAWADEVVGRHARYADLTLAGPQLAADRALFDKVVGGALFMSGRPLLLSPADVTPTLAPRRVLVGWDGGIEAVRATGAALDMLVGADEVHIALVDPIPGPGGHGDEPGADIATWLARHGARVAIDLLPGAGRTVAETLARHARDVGADLLVLGAYGHSRLRERIFGGTTRSIVEAPPLPVLLAR
ncbi:MAG: universal stress protein [Rhizobiaceae bacterium]|nr:universal stress protein [Rhizobiaceae bacterium]